MNYHTIVFVLLVLTIISLIVACSILARNNKRLQLKSDQLDYATAVAMGKLNKLSLDFFDKDAECEQAKADLEACKQKRKYVKKKCKS